MEHINFNLIEIFEMAEQIEINGAIFYKHAASNFPENSEIRNLLEDLAEQEDGHVTVFEDLKKRYIATTSIIDDSDDTALHYLSAIAVHHVFNNKTQKNEISSAETKNDIIKFAIEREKDAILFYIGIRDSLQNTEDAEAVDSLIKEEKKHLVLLTKKTDYFNQMFI